jgi:hypothetical protein
MKGKGREAARNAFSTMEFFIGILKETVPSVSKFPNVSLNGTLLGFAVKSCQNF